MRDVVPIHYRIHLEPDLERFQFQESVRILIRAFSAVRKICLNAVDLAVWTCETGWGMDSGSVPFHLDPHREELKIFLPEAMDGEFEIGIDFEGCINDHMMGFYRSTHMRKGREEYIPRPCPRS